MEWLVVLCFVVIAAVWIWFRARLNELESQIRRDAEWNRDQVETQLSALTARVHRLENALANQRKPVDPASDILEPPPASAPVPDIIVEQPPVSSRASAYLRRVFRT